MADIPRVPDLIPTICKIRIIFPNQVASFIRNTESLTADVTLNNGDAWNDIYFTKHTIVFDEVQKQSEAGDYYDQQLRFIIPGQSGLYTAMVKSIIDHPLIALFEYSNGEKKIIGSPSNPARVLKNFKTDQKGSGTEFTIRCQDQAPAYFLITA